MRRVEHRCAGDVGNGASKKFEAAQTEEPWARNTTVISAGPIDYRRISIGGLVPSISGSSVMAVMAVMAVLAAWYM